MIVAGFDLAPVLVELLDLYFGDRDAVRFSFGRFAGDLTDFVPWGDLPPGIPVRVVARRPSMDHPGRLVNYFTLDVPGHGVHEVAAEWRETFSFFGKVHQK